MLTSVAGALQYGHGANVLPLFLGHKFPAVRAATSEAVCISVQLCEPSAQLAEAEELLLQTQWLTNLDEALRAGRRISALLH